MQPPDDSANPSALVLAGIRVVEMAGLAPVPFCGMILSDFGADVVRVDRLGPDPIPRHFDPMARGKRSIQVDLKSEEGTRITRSLLEKADVVLDPYRPGVMERLGLGPDSVCAANPRVVFARVTGYGQTGPLRDRAGHDINYLALSGALSMFGRPHTPPVPPANLLADFAGGGLTCALGVVLALLERERSGRGQVLDVSMTEGTAALSSAILFLRHLGIWNDQRGANWFDGGAPWYDVYSTSDGKYVAVGAFEPAFFRRLLQGLGLVPEDFGHPHDRSTWPALRQAISSRFLEKTRDEWIAVFDGSDACVTPVLDAQEALQHCHVRQRQAFFQSSSGLWQPAPAPRLSRTPARSSKGSPVPGEHTKALLLELGCSVEDVNALLTSGVVACVPSMEVGPVPEGPDWSKQTNGEGR